MPSERRRRQARPGRREWTPDDHWPRDEAPPQGSRQDWARDGGQNQGWPHERNADRSQGESPGSQGGSPGWQRGSPGSQDDRGAGWQDDSNTDWQHRGNTDWQRDGNTGWSHGAGTNPPQGGGQDWQQGGGQDWQQAGGQNWQQGGGQDWQQGGGQGWPHDRDKDWPRDGEQDWPADGGPADGRRADGRRADGRRASASGGPTRSRTLRIVLSVAASLLVVVGLGAYGLARVEHKTSINARQDSATAPCPQRASTGTSSTGTSSTGQSSSGQHGADCATSGSAAAGGVAAGSSATPGTSAKPGKPHKSASATPTPTPSASRHTHAPAPPPAPTPTPTKSGGAPGGAASSSAAAQVLSLINQARAQAGLSAYTISSGLDTSSRKHTTVMASGCGLSHQCPGEAALGDRLTAAGVHWTSAGENIGEGGPEPDSSSAIASMAVGLTQDMLNEKPPDDGHRLNILSSSFHHIGIYVFRDSHGTVWMTQDFSN